MQFRRRLQRRRRTVKVGQLELCDGGRDREGRRAAERIEEDQRLRPILGAAAHRDLPVRGEMASFRSADLLGLAVARKKGRRGAAGERPAKVGGVGQEDALRGLDDGLPM